MPKLSPTTGTFEDYGPVADRHDDLDGYTTSFFECKETQDMTGMLSSLPNGQCHCPHWGYVTEGRWTVKYDDRVEVYEAGDAFYMSPGHVPTEIAAGTKTVMFSPTEELKATDAAIMAFMQSQGAQA